MNDIPDPKPEPEQTPDVTDSGELKGILKDSLPQVEIKPSNPIKHHQYPEPTGNPEAEPKP